MFGPFGTGFGVILPAAGSGTRMGNSFPKQYREIKGKPLFLYALEEFISLPFVTDIALVGDNPECMLNTVKKYELPVTKIVFVQGGTSRHRSIQKGLQALMERVDNLKFVAVHDAVRPLVPRGQLLDLYEKCRDFGASGFAAKLVSTVVSKDKEGTLVNTLVRDHYCASETPQMFIPSYLEMAYNAASDEQLDNGTECLELVKEHCGISPKVIIGPPELLWKVTYNKDLYTAEGVLRAMNRVLILCPDRPNACLAMLTLALKEKTIYVTHAHSNPEATEVMSRMKINTLIQVHMGCKDTTHENQLFLLDDSQLGLMLHVILEEPGGKAAQIGCDSTSTVQDLCYRTGQVASKYIRHDKGKLVVHHVAGQADRQFVKMILTVVMADADVFSGHVLYV